MSILRLVVQIFLIWVSAIVNATASDFEYWSCSNSPYGLPIGNCEEIVVSHDFSDVRVNDVIDQGSLLTKNKDFIAIESKILPIAIPSRDYAEKAAWMHGDFYYVKVARAVKNFPLPDLIDVIAIVPKGGDLNLENIAKKESEFQLQMTAEGAFSYSEKRGILSISIIGKARNTTAFYCASAKCLFEKVD